MELSRLFFSRSELWHKQLVGRDGWICATCVSKWSDATHGEAPLPFACPEYKTRAEAFAGSNKSRKPQPTWKGPGSGAQSCLPTTARPRSIYA